MIVFNEHFQNTGVSINSMHPGTVSGKFFNLTTREEPAPPALDKEVADELWGKSLELAGLQGSKQ